MARCKNVSGPIAGSGGSPGGDGGGDPPRRLTAIDKGKGKKVMTKKRKASDTASGRAATWDPSWHHHARGSTCLD